LGLFFKLYSRTSYYQDQDVLLKNQDDLLQDQDVLLKNQDDLLKDQDVLLKDQDVLLQDQDILLKGHAWVTDTKKRCHSSSLRAEYGVVPLR